MFLRHAVAVATAGKTAGDHRDWSPVPDRAVGSRSHSPGMQCLYTMCTETDA